MERKGAQATSSVVSIVGGPTPVIVVIRATSNLGSGSLEVGFKCGGAGFCSEARVALGFHDALPQSGCVDVVAAPRIRLL